MDALSRNGLRYPIPSYGVSNDVRQGWALATNTNILFNLALFISTYSRLDRLILERPPWLESMNSKQSRNAATSLVAAGTILRETSPFVRTCHRGNRQRFCHVQGTGQ